MGITLFSLVYGNVPFVDSSIPKLYEKIQNDEVVFPEVPKISDDLRNTIARMLEKDATNRITLPQLKVNRTIYEFYQFTKICVICLLGKSMGYT